jgi:hypothetical protein
LESWGVLACEGARNPGARACRSETCSGPASRATLRGNARLTRRCRQRWQKHAYAISGVGEPQVIVFHTICRVVRFGSRKILGAPCFVEDIGGHLASYNILGVVHTSCTYRGRGHHFPASGQRARLAPRSDRNAPLALYKVRPAPSTKLIQDVTPWSSMGPATPLSATLAEMRSLNSSPEVSPRGHPPLAPVSQSVRVSQASGGGRARFARAQGVIDQSLCILILDELERPGNGDSLIISVSGFGRPVLCIVTEYFHDIVGWGVGPRRVWRS